LFIDDLGKEQSELVYYGSVIRPLSELLYQRYENGALTFTTSNFKLESFATKYTPEVADRLPEMFNEIVLPGQTRRN
jgi:DNA replication protein DnaC